MARRKDHTRDELIELAIDCGRSLVEREGPPALTARKVAKAMGYTAGTLYNLFDNIEGLMVAINARTLALMAERMAPIVAEEAEPRLRLHRLCMAYLEFEQDEPQLWKLLFATPIHRDSLDEDYHRATHKVFDPVTATLLPLSQNEAAARQDTKIIWSTLHGICLLQQNKKLDVTETDSAEALVDRFLHNYLKP